MVITNRKTNQQITIHLKDEKAGNRELASLARQIANNWKEVFERQARADKQEMVLLARYDPYRDNWHTNFISSPHNVRGALGDNLAWICEHGFEVFLGLLEG